VAKADDAIRAMRAAGELAPQEPSGPKKTSTGRTFLLLAELITKRSERSATSRPHRPTARAGGVVVIESQIKLIAMSMIQFPIALTAPPSAFSPARSTASAR
jgi:hypothetical protein